MKFRDHCEESVRLFGKPYEEVHAWLDELSASTKASIFHRRYRHHLKGIEEVRRLWGDDAAEVAKQHIISDLCLDGWKESDGLPKDMVDYINMGLF